MRKNKKYFKYPILSNLIIFQILAIIIGSGLLFASYYLSTSAQIESAISKIKENVKPNLELKQEEWRTWQYMTLQDALQQSIKTYKKKYNLAELKVIPRSDLPQKLTKYDIVIPDKPDFMDTIVYARISPEYLDSLVENNRFILLLISCLGLIFVGVVIFSGRYIRNKMYMPIIKLNHAFLKLKSKEELNIDHINASGEVHKFLEYIKQMYQKTRESERMAVVGQMASQVAHDIRSPLAALRMSVSNVSELSEEKRLLIRRAVQRIDDIANDLGDKNKRIQGSLEHSTDGEKLSVQLLSSLIESLVSEKRMQYRLRSNLEITSSLTKSAYGLFAKIKPSEFKRVLSNLINNSAEAISDQGKIEVSLSGDDGQIILQVKDDGKGIDPKILPKISKKGVSVGKEQGSGLGLFHAQQHIEAWDGRMKIDSEKERGTCIKIILPQHEPPPWFVSQIDLQGKTHVIILDDDQSIHHVWNNRFNSIGKHDLSIVHLTTSEAFDKWLCDQNDQINLNNYLFLFDYELLGSKKTGLDLIKEYNLSSSAVLVTSRVEEDHVIQPCLDIQLKLLPKSLAEFVPLAFTDSVEQNDCILIDDDEIVQTFWKLEAKLKGKRLKTFTRFAEFNKDKSNISKNTPIYIDANLANGERGEVISQKVYELGFENLYLATGQDPSDFPPMPWLKGIVGKEPRF